MQWNQHGPVRCSVSGWYTMDTNAVAIRLQYLYEPEKADFGFRSGTVVAGFGKNGYIKV